MKPNRKLLGAAAMTVALTAGGAVGATLGNPLASGAQDNPTTTTAPDADADASPDRSPTTEGRGGRGGVDLEAAATALGLTTDELRTELKADKTLAEIATEQGVDEQALIDALVAAGETRLDEVRAALPERIAELIDQQLPRGGPGGHEGRRGPGHRGPADDGGN